MASMKEPPAAAEWAVAGRALAGASRSGDRHFAAPLPDGILIAVIDGLGHGPDAARAAEEAAGALAESPGEALIPLIQRCHERLRATRGAVMSVASIDARKGLLAWIGVGNVEGFLLRGDPAAAPSRESLLTRGGVVGDRLPPLHASELPIAPGDLLVFATDGIRSGYVDAIDRKAPPQGIADAILAGYARPDDDALVLVARYLGFPGAGGG